MAFVNATVNAAWKPGEGEKLSLSDFAAGQRKPGEESASECQTLGQLLGLINGLLPTQVKECEKLLSDLCRTERVASYKFHGEMWQDIDKTLKANANGTTGKSEQEDDYNERSRRPAEVNMATSQPDIWPFSSHVSFFPSAAHGGFRQRLFVLFDDGPQSICGRVADAVCIIAIIVSTVAFVMESMPQFRVRPSECRERRTVVDCEPLPDESFFYVEAVCITVFTLDYLVRMSTVHSVPSDVDNCLLRTLVYARQPLNIVDLVAILPFYIGLLMPGRASPLLRFLRLARVMRLFKIAKHHQGFAMFAEVLQLSGQPLFILVFANIVLAVVFGSLIYFTEGMNYSISEEFIEQGFTTGVYVRPTAASSGGLGGGTEKIEEVSPYRSIPYAVWWALVTMTTVGYGDYSPTSLIGKCIGVLCFYVGIIFLALPISVLGTNFEIVYNRRVKEKQPKRKTKSSQRTSYQVRTKHQEAAWIPRVDGIRAKFFVLLQDPSASRLGKLITIFIIAVILFSTACFIMETMPVFRRTPEACLSDTGVATSTENCEPRADEIFKVFEVTCIILFTVEYFSRVALVHSVRPEDCGVQVEPHAVVSPLKLTGLYCLQPLNILDLVVIMPFYMGFMFDGGSETSVLRVLRLVRIFRVMKMPKMRACADMFLAVVADSLPALALMFFMTMLMCVLFGSLMFFAENNNYEVDFRGDAYGPEWSTAYPWGVYVRPDATGYGKEPSPYISILYSFWWFFTTATTVGYGDDYPTTTAGRCVGVAAFYTGIVLLALPITIVGGCFNTHYPNWVKEFEVAPELNGQPFPTRSSTVVMELLRDGFDDSQDDDFDTAPATASAGKAWQDGGRDACDRQDLPGVLNGDRPVATHAFGLREGCGKTRNDDTSGMTSGEDPPNPPEMLS